ncbi:514_t:CDS:2, partial [Ambispora leptoticha]
EADWQNLYQEVKRVLKPGGILEQHEYDGLSNTTISGPKLKKFQKYYKEACSARGLNVRFACQLNERVKMAGFEYTRASYIPVALGKRGGKIGEIWAANAKEFSLAMKPWLAG